MGSEVCAATDARNSRPTPIEPPEHAIQHVAAAEKSHWLLWDAVHPGNVARAYQEIAWE